MSGFSIPYLPYDRIREIANEFLKKYHPSGTIPVSIEESIEFKMGFNIVPMPGLQDTLENDGFEVLGFTSYNLKEITVDQWIWQHRPGRYRFTLAHEVGHIVMHRELYESADFHTIEGWEKFINGIPDKIHGRYEWQAYAFGGLVLVPHDHLKSTVDRHMRAILKLLQKDKIAPSDAWESIWDQIYELAAKDFEVSPEVIQRRVAYDKIQESYDHLKEGVVMIEDAFEDFKSRLELNSTYQEVATTRHKAIRGWIESFDSGIETKLIGSPPRYRGLRPRGSINSYGNSHGMPPVL